MVICFSSSGSWFSAAPRSCSAYATCSGAGSSLSVPVWCDSFDLDRRARPNARLRFAVRENVAAAWNIVARRSAASAAYVWFLPHGAEKIEIARARLGSDLRVLRAATVRERTRARVRFPIVRSLAVAALFSHAHRTACDKGFVMKRFSFRV